MVTVSFSIRDSFTLLVVSPKLSKSKNFRSDDRQLFYPVGSGDYRKLRGYKCWPSGTSALPITYQCKEHYDPRGGTCPCCSGKILKNGGNSTCV